MEDFFKNVQYLNLGCGNRYHPNWINIDISPNGLGVIPHDLSQGIPLPDASCDVVYHSHIIEHIRRVDALPFMQECYRVLKPNGVLRVATPDLERICRLYLEKLEAVINGNNSSSCDYDWMLLEMFDQTTREQRGGKMLDYLRQNPLPNEVFIYERIGEEGRNIVRLLGAQVAKSAAHEITLFKPWRFLIRGFYRRLRFLPHWLKSRLLARLLGSQGLVALEIGRFRLNGEVHHWMYDRYSFAQLMMAAGFQNPLVQTATNSSIANWTTFNLDTLADGTVNKPDSLFMEATKPKH